MEYRGATATAVNNVIGVAALLSSRNSRHKGLLPGFIVTAIEKSSLILKPAVDHIWGISDVPFSGAEKRRAQMP